MYIMTSASTTTSSTTTFPSSSLGLDAVNVGFLKDVKTGLKKTLPLVISPRWNASVDFLEAWCVHNRAWLDAQLLAYGAILLRGFDVDSAVHVERAAQAFQPRLNDTYRGTSPRRLQPGTSYVFSAAEVPNNYPIAQHIEMSFLNAPPRQLFFGCVQPSQKAGGETALADFRAVYRDLSTGLKQKLLDKGLLYTRTHSKYGNPYFTYDVADMLGWTAMFGTDDKAEVERLCAAEGIPVTWKGEPGKEIFVSQIKSHAFQLHPVTGEHVWFNHTQVFHWTTFSAELWFAWKRTHEWRLLVHWFFITIFCVVKYGLLRHRMALHATFGDGEPISVAEMSEIRQAIHNNMVFNRWEKGDVVMIDNFSTSHGRQPTYDKGRKIVVAWADPLVKANAVTSIEPVPKICKEEILNANTTTASATTATLEEEPVYMENPQERTPESTLTTADKQKLQQELHSKLFQEELSKKMVHDLTMNPQEMTDDSLHRLKVIVQEAERNRLHHRKSHSQPVLHGSVFLR